MATLAAVLEVELPADAGPDSFSFLPTLTNEPAASLSTRDKFVMRAGSRTSMMTIRSGDWKLITELGSGGFSDPKHIEPGPGDPAGQLYNLVDDRAETNNLYLQKPDIVARLTKEMNTIVDDGRSRLTKHEVDRAR